MGQIYHARVCNLSGVVETLNSNTGVTFATVTIAPNVCAGYTILVTGIAPAPAITIISS